MAFTGTATITVLGTRIARLTGISLAAGASGTISGSGGAGDETLPSSFPALSVNEAMVSAVQVASGATSPIVIAKAGSPAVITVENTDGGNATGGLEIYIEMPHSIGK